MFMYGGLFIRLDKRSKRTVNATVIAENSY